MLCYKVQIDTPDKEFLTDTLEHLRCLKNEISAMVFGKKFASNYNAMNKVLYNTLRKKHPEFHSAFIQLAEKDVAATYRTIKANKHKIAKQVVYSQRNIRLNKTLYSRFTRESVELFSSGSRKRVKATFRLYPKIKELLSRYEVSDMTLLEKNGILHLAIPFKVPETVLPNEEVLGVDRGIRCLISTSDGLTIKGTEFQKYKRKIRFAKRNLQSKGTKSARKRLKKLKRKESNFSKNYTHLVVNEIMKTDKGIIALECLRGIKQKTSKKKIDTKEGTKEIKRKSHNRNFSQIPLYMLQSIATYKAQHLGKVLVTVNPFETSKKDCRGLEKGVRVGRRYYTVDKKQLDADVNAAVNIKCRYLSLPSSAYPKDMSYLGRLIVNQPIVCKPVFHGITSPQSLLVGN